MNFAVCKKLIVPVAVGLLSTGAMGQAKAEKTITPIVSANVFTKSHSRGRTMSENPSLELTAVLAHTSGVYFVAWGNVLLDEKSNEPRDNGTRTKEVGTETDFREVDLVLGYSLPLAGPVGVDVSLAEFLYPGREEDGSAIPSEWEASVKFTVDTVASPYLKLDYGVGGPLEGRVYGQLGVKQEVLRQGDLGLNLGGHVAYMDRGDIDEEDLPGKPDAGIHHAAVSVGVTYGIFNASINGIFETDEDVFALNDDDLAAAQGLPVEQEPFYASVGVSQAF